MPNLDVIRPNTTRLDSTAILFGLLAALAGAGCERAPAGAQSGLTDSDDDLRHRHHRCGDGVCWRETCESCPQDCAALCAPADAGTPDSGGTSEPPAPDAGTIADASVAATDASRAADATATPPPGAPSAYFNSSEPGCDPANPNPDYLFCDDFEDGDWVTKNCDEATRAAAFFRLMDGAARSITAPIQRARTSVDAAGAAPPARPARRGAVPMAGSAAR
jgi:hypothetical protein